MRRSSVITLTVGLLMLLAIVSAQAAAPTPKTEPAFSPPAASPATMGHTVAPLVPAEKGSGRTLLKLRRGVSQSRARKDGKRLGYRVVESLSQIGWTVVEPIDRRTSAASLRDKVRRAGIALRADPEITVHADYQPSDPLYRYQWGFENTGIWGGTAGADAKLVSAWDWSRGSGVVVAVVDTGVDESHPELTGKRWINTDEVPGNGVDDDHNGKIDDVYGWDFFRAEATVFDTVDGDKHGTHVAGTIAASTDNGIGGAGTAPGARIMPVKFLGPTGGSDTNGAAGIIYAVDNGASVINCSWGGSTSSQILSDALAYAASHGVLVVCAAGNSAANTDVTPSYPASYPATNVVSVAALNNADTIADFSNRGATTVDLGAPGEWVVSSQPKLGASLFASTAAYKVIYDAFPVECITSATARDDLVARSMSLLTTSTSNPVLVVDDSWPAVGGEAAGARLSAYTTALSNAGYSAVSTWRTDLSGTPTTATLAGKTVIWFTGASSYGVKLYQTYGTLSLAERTVLGTYLDGGGRLLLSSGDFGYDARWFGTAMLTWYRTYLHATYVDDDPWTGTVHGTTAPFDFADFDVDDPLRGTIGYDDVAPYDAYATIVANWDDYANISGTSMASPHVAGVIALMRARFPRMSATDLKARLLSTTRPVAALSGITVTGGALDAAAAVGQLAPPAGFSASGGIESVTLSWTNPADDDFVLTRVLARTDAEPTGPDDASATVVYEGTGTFAEQSGLAAGVPVTYAAYSKNLTGSWTDAATATATPAPLLAVDDAYTVRWNATLTVDPPGVRANDPYTGGDTVLVAGPEHGTVTLAADGSFAYRPAAGYYGPDSFGYSVSDGVHSQQATVSIDVRRYRLDALSASAAPPGTAVTFTGTGFGAEQGSGCVTFAGVKGAVVSWSDTQVVALVPPGSAPGYAGVIQDGRVSNGLWFKPTPRLDSLSVANGGPGTLVTITGVGFGISQNAGFVTFGGTTATVVSWSDTLVTVLVPEGAVSGYAGVFQNGVMSNGKWFRPYSVPTLASLSTRNAAAGTAVTFTGADFGAVQGSGYVTFGGVQAIVTSWSDTAVTALVPAGASAGYAGVCQNGLMSNGLWFVPFASPHVDTLSTFSASAGTPVTITGSGFGAAQGSGWVTFGGVSATVVSWSDTSVTALVPAGAPSGYVGVCQNGVMSNGKYFVPML